VRPAARLSAQVSSVPDLLSRAGVAGANSRRGEIQLVESVADFSIADFQLVFSIGNWKSKNGVKE
jgi:hypothetical protein